MKFKNQNEYLCENIVDWADESWIKFHITSFINKNLTLNSALKFNKLIFYSVTYLR